MNKEQMNAARKTMTEWLAHPAELGKAPAKIECAGEFDLYDMHYYIFKYKKGVLGKWLIGVCGGYEEDGTEDCGHVFSKMEEYNEPTAMEQAIQMVETVRQYYIEQAKKVEKRKENPGTFINYVLLEEAKWDKAAFLQDLKDTWGIEDDSEEEEEKDEEGKDAFVISYQGAMIAVSLIDVHIPEGETEGAAANNFLWKDGVEQVKKHQAHIIVAIMGRNISPIESGKLLVKAVTSICKQDGVLGIYTGSTVYALDYYLRFAGVLADDLFPLYNLIWVGLYNGQNGLCGYTSGMINFGYDEIEVLDSKADMKELHGFLVEIANYVIMENVVLKDGETIGFSAEQKLPITRSKGVAVDGDSLKIVF